MMTKEFKIATEDLSWKCDEKIFDFKSTKDVEPLKGVIGQDRALKSLDFGLGIFNHGYNVYVLGESGTGKETIVKDLLESKAEKEKVPDDICYVFDFQNSDKPKAITLPSGKGYGFKSDMAKLVDTLLSDIPKVFESKDYESHKDEILDGQQERTKDIFYRVEKKCDEEGFKLKRSAGGLTIAAINKQGKSLSDDEYKKLSTKERNSIEDKLKKLQTMLSDAVRDVREVEKNSKDRLDKLDNEVVQYVINPYFDELILRYKGFENIVQYFNDVKDDIFFNFDDFRSKEDVGLQIPGLKFPKQEVSFKKYDVNLLVDNTATKGAPVIFETNPTYYNLFGRLDYSMQYGVASTDFTMLKAGSLHRANGGYLVVNALDMLKNIFVYDALKRLIKNKELAFEDVWEQYRLATSSSLKPEPIKTDIKIVIIGDPYIYYLLHNVDKDYKELFKVKVDFDNTIEKTKDNIKDIAAFVSLSCQKNNLLPFDKGATARIVERGVRMSSDKEKISSRFGEIESIVIEASYFATKGGSKLVKRSDVDKAVEEKIYRHSKFEDKLREYITKDTIMVDVEGEVVGQVNGLAILDSGDYDFGKPSRVTAKAYMGDRGVVNIEREVKMSGKIYNKAHMILTSFLGERYAVDFPMTLTASICFEQLYEGIEGDSATCAEIYALVSALSGVKITQGIAVTGSMNQQGEVQPIGGVNAKIEGFFKVCKDKGLTGEQGVIIPSRNVKNLMLSQEVIDAVEAGNFTVYAISHVDEGLKILTGMEVGLPDEHGHFKEDTVNGLAYKKLKHLARSIKDFAKGPLKKKVKEPSNDNDDDNGNDEDKDGEKL